MSDCFMHLIIKNLLMGNLLIELGYHIQYHWIDIIAILVSFLVYQ